MLKAGPGIALFKRQPQTRLRAVRSPRSRSILWNFANLHARAMAARARTMAITRACLRRPQLLRRVRREQECSAKQTDKQKNRAEPQASPVLGREQHRAHAEILPVLQVKNR